MYWVEVQQSLIRHPKTRKLAGTLTIHRMQAVGHMVALWCWCVDYAADGSLADITADDVAEGACWAGDPDAFVAALRESGFVNPDDSIHDWADYTGGKLEQLARVREGNRTRQKTYRERHPEVAQERNALRNALRNGDVTRSPYRTEQNQTEPDRTTIDAGASASKPRRKPKVYLSATWRPGDALLAWCDGKGFSRADVDLEVERFLNHFVDKEARPDWDASFRNWMLSPFRQPARASPAMNGRGRNNDPDAMFALARKYEEQGR